MVNIGKLKKRLHWEDLVEETHCDEWGKYRIFSLRPSHPTWYTLDFVFDDECRYLQSFHFGIWHAHYESYECEKCNINLAVMAADKLITHDWCLLEELTDDGSYSEGSLVGAHEIAGTLSKDVKKFKRIFFNKEPEFEDINYDRYCEEQHLFIEKGLQEWNKRIHTITSKWSASCEQPTQDIALSQIARMDENMFWQTIEKIQHLEEPDSGNALLFEIHKWPPDKLLSFQLCFDDMIKKAYHWDLWGACELIEGEVISQEHFIGFLQGIIAKGKEIFYHAIKNADSLADLHLSQFLTSTGIDAIIEMEYKSKAGSTMPRALKFQQHEPAGLQWDFKDKEARQTRFPRLYERYAEIFEEDYKGTLEVLLNMGKSLLSPDKHGDVS